MVGPVTRRRFVRGVAQAGGVAALFGPRAFAAVPHAPQAGARRPVVIASANGLYPESENGQRLVSAIERTLSLLQDEATATRRFGLLEAVVDGVRIIEDDPDDHSVGLGGLPNEEGVVQLDASVMFGPTHQAGAVAGLENIQNPARVAMQVLRFTDHSLLVGDGAYRFARAHGEPHVDLLTAEARRIWLYWKQKHSDRDDWIPPPDDEVEPSIRDQFSHGTIHLSAVDGNGDLAAVTSTSGLAFKIPGRAGDSPIVGAGMYCDNEVGAAGATGRGEEAIVNCGAFSVVEAMRAGLAPTEACLEVLKRVDRQARKRGLFRDGKPDFDITFYALRKDGSAGSAAMWQGKQFAIVDADAPQGRHEACGWLYDR